MSPGPKLRYLVVVVFGFAVDLGITLTLAEGLGAPLPWAAASGFGAALLLNYLLFEFWVFREKRARLSMARVGATLASAALALGVRLLAIEATRRIIGDEGGAGTAIAVLIGAAASMTVNYLVVSTAFAWLRRREPGRAAA